MKRRRAAATGESQKSITVLRRGQMSDSRKRAVTPKRGRVRKATLDRGVTVWTDGTLYAPREAL